ncbi:hypothetical protein ACGFU4_12685 [Streptomyces sp. NPDC048511]
MDLEREWSRFMERGDLTDKQAVMLETLLPKGTKTEGSCPSRFGGG